MYFDDNSDEKKLFEDIQFKRRVQFVDDDNIINIGLKPFSKTADRSEVKDRECQVNIQNQLVSTAIQTRAKKNKEIQTEADETAEINSKNADSSRVKRLFEKRAYLFEEAIIENNTTTAFNNYDVDWYGGSSTITNPFILTNKQFVKDEEAQVIAVEWNSSGTTICVGYGRYDHESVCTHRGCLCTWNIDRLKIDLNKPDTSVETPCCISTIATHPEYPGIIAVGFFNGEIHVYDIRQQTDPLVASVTDKKELHRDEVTNIRWIKDPRSSKKKYYLLSSSRDGKILMWNALPAKNQLKLVEGFLMLIDYLPKKNSRAYGVEMGVSSFSINREDKETFIVGCDSGGLFKCSFSGKSVVNTKWEEEFPIELRSPVELTFDAQFGPIYSISYSPYHRNLILTCGTDSEIKLYSLLQTSSLMSFCPENGYLYCVEWSPSRPCVFACGSHNGNILIYDLLETGKTMCEITQASDSPIYTICFNQQRPELLASGDRSGVVKIWKLSQNLSKPEPNELKKLNDISEKPFEKS